MKKIIIITLINFFAVSAFTQKVFKNDTTASAETTEDHTRIPIYRSYSEHGYLNRFIGFDVNDVLPDLQMFIQSKTALTSLDALSGVKDGWFRIAYTPGIGQGAYQKKVWIMTKTDKVNKITQMKITGDPYYVISIFCSYWVTRLDFEAAKKKEIVIVRNIDERIALTTGLGKGSATIIITKNK